MPKKIKNSKKESKKKNEELELKKEEFEIHEKLNLEEQTKEKPKTNFNLIDENKFIESFNVENFSPVLEKNFENSKPINLEQVAFSQPLSEKSNSEKEKNDSGYLAKIKTDDEPKYISGSNEYMNYQSSSRFDSENEKTDSFGGREIKPMTNEWTDNQKPKYEFERADDFQNTKKRKDPFERREIKYKTKM